MTAHSARFEIGTLALAIFLGSFAIATIFAEALTPKSRPYFFDTAEGNPSFRRNALADFASSIGPYRGDLLANVAFVDAGPSFRAPNAKPSSSDAESRQKTRGFAIEALSFSPHAADVWLLLAALTQDDTKSRTEALKMSFLTAPGDATLIPGRLLVLATSPAIDADLQSLARGDLRLVLTRRPDLKPAVVRAYRNGTAEAKGYLFEVIKGLDQSFAGTLQ